MSSCCEEARAPGVILALIPSFRVEFVLFSFIILLLLFLSIFISGAQHALFSLTPNELEELEKTKKSTFRHVQHLIARPRHLLVLVEMLQTFITVTILFLSVKIGIYLFAGTPLSWIKYGIHALLMVFILLTFQEIIPKFFGGANNLLWSRMMATPLYFLGRLLYPLTSSLIYASRYVEQHFTVKDEKTEEEELMQKPDEQIAEETTGRADLPFLGGLLKFSTITVRQVMKPRIDMVCVDEKTSFDQLQKIVRDIGYSRLPVFKENLDNIRGILYTKDLIILWPEKVEWQPLMREASFVPESKKISELLKELQHSQNHMAIVIDEFGRTAGLVTLEDIVEEIIGEIRDETDERIEHDFVKADDNNFLFEGKIPLSDFCRIMNIEEDYFDNVRNESDSLGGLLLEINGTIPKANDTITYKSFTFTVLSLQNYRIKRVKVERKMVDEMSDD